MARRWVSRGGLLLTLVALGLTAPSVASAQFTFGPVVNVSRSTGESSKPHMALDGAGTLHVVWGDDSGNPGHFQIKYRRSFDGGQTFTGTIQISNTVRAALRPRVAVHGGAVYVVWMQDPDSAPGGDTKEIMFSRSLNDGASFGAPINVSNSPGHSQEGRVAVGPNGTVYVIWDEGSGGRHIALARSFDGGGSFETPFSIAPVATPLGCAPDGVGNCDTVYPGLTTDPNSGAVYAIWHDKINGTGPQILFTRSFDGGNTFSAPLQISNAVIHAHCASVTVGPSGRIMVAYEERKQVAPAPHTHAVMFVQSTDAGASFGTPIKLSANAPAFTTAGYPWPVETPNGLILVAWEDNTAGGELDAVVAVSSNGGASFGTPTNISNNPGSNSSEVVAAAGPDSAVYVLWEDAQLGNSEAFLRRGTPSGGGGGGAPAFTIGATSAAPNPVAPGASTTVTTTITDTGGAASGINLDLEIFSSSGTRVNQQFTTGQSFAAGEAKSFQWTWAVPASQAAGTYTVKIGVFSSSWALLAWNNNAASVSVQSGGGGGGPFTLTVVKTGTGSGTVTSTPAGIDCGADCSEPYASGTVVHLAATPDAANGSTFGNFSGCTTTSAKPGLGTCDVTMTANTTVTVTFTGGGGGAPAFTIGPTSAAPNPVTRGNSTTITTTVTDTGGAASGINIDLEIFSSSGTRVNQQITTGQNFAAGEAKSFQWTWAVPATLPSGTYTVKIGVFSGNWATLFKWDNQATLVTVNP